MSRRKADVSPLPDPPMQDLPGIRGGRVWSFTRDQLIDALRRRKTLPVTETGPGQWAILEGDAVFEHMADSIIEALES